MTRVSDPREVLAMAGGLLRRAEPTTAGLWPRASALLALQAVEASLVRVWARRAPDLQGLSMGTQLICLRSYLGDPKLAARAGHAWSALRRASHHHAYELPASHSELNGWLSTVAEALMADAGSHEAKPSW